MKKERDFAMKNKHAMVLLCSLLFMLIICGPAVKGQTIYKDLKYSALRDLVIPEPQEVTLDNGMILFLLEDHEFPFINMTALTRTGAVYDPDDRIGLADICGTVMRTGGSAEMPGDEMDEMLESIAASVETVISLTNGRATLFTLKDHIDPVLKAFAGVLMHPAFPEDKIELARVEQKSFISRRNDNPGSIASREFSNIIYGKGHVYSRYPEYDHISAMTRDDLVAFHKQFYHPDTTLIAVCGDFSTPDMVKKIELAFEGWEKSAGPVPEPPQVSYDFKPSVNLVAKEEFKQSNIYIISAD